MREKKGGSRYTMKFDSNTRSSHAKAHRQTTQTLARRAVRRDVLLLCIYQYQCLQYPK